MKNGANVIISVCRRISKKVLKGGTRERDPRYQKLRVRGIRIRNTRRGQPARCAMGKSRPGGTASLITVNLDAK